MSEILNLAGCRQDGSEFPVEISLSYLETIHGIFVIAFVSDITRCKHAEEEANRELESFNYGSPRSTETTGNG